MARELAPVGLRSSPNKEQPGEADTPQRKVLGLLRSPTRASPLATGTGTGTDIDTGADAGAGAGADAGLAAQNPRRPTPFSPCFHTSPTNP
ncbi:hypothetical protein CXQ82_27065 [Pseudomonas sp. S09G 359]|nr:hypothetical protein CXQ82_27065 [Pseudomonas sp. S09G 359]